MILCAYYHFNLFAGLISTYLAPISISVSLCLSLSFSVCFFHFVYHPTCISFRGVSSFAHALTFLIFNSIFYFAFCASSIDAFSLCLSHSQDTIFEISIIWHSWFNMCLSLYIYKYIYVNNVHKHTQAHTFYSQAVNRFACACIMLVIVLVILSCPCSFVFQSFTSKAEKLMYLSCQRQKATINEFCSVCHPSWSWLLLYTVYIYINSINWNWILLIVH